MFEVCEELEIDSRVASVSIPLMVALNRDGSALFIGIVTIFLATINQVALNASHIFLIGYVCYLNTAYIVLIQSKTKDIFF